ncbi:MAG: LacI family transcriptional regulator [Verrucomicrobiales bacterium]|jgi:LacI family transcriptional regulator|nr:LacI family transcriptional regulator [Verrucomicrobiales bacterium]
MESQKPSSKPVTIRQLANLAGVSRTTVSLALRNHPVLPAQTRERIQKLARQYNYNPDSLVSTLMTRIRTNRQKRVSEKLALLTFWDTRDGWRSNPNDRRYFLGATQRAEELGYEIEHFWAKEPRLSDLRLSKILYTRAIQGIVLLPVPFPVPSSLTDFDWDKFSVVSIAFALENPCLNSVMHEHFNGMRRCMRALRQRGYRRIGFANLTRQNGGVGERWLAAYWLEQHLSGQAQLQPYLEEKWNLDSFAAWLQKQRPDVIISNFTTPLEFLRKLNISVPDKIAFASLDLADEQFTHSGINQQPEQIGRVAIDFLISQLHHNKYGIPRNAEYLEIEGIWQDGDTTRKSSV